MAISIEQTKARFGYLPSSLSRWSQRHVICICDFCGAAEEHRWDHIALNTRTLCRGCLHGPREQAQRQKKREATLLKEHGVTNPSKLPGFYETAQATWADTLGTSHPMRSAAVQKKHRASLQANLGVDSPMQHPDVRATAQATWKKKLGVENPMQHAATKVKAITRKIEIWGSLSGGTYGPAEHAFGDEIRAWFQPAEAENITTLVLPSAKSLDVYIPHKKIAIEYDGLFWHCQNSPEARPRYYHRDKSREGNAQGLRVIRIYEDEWRDRHPQVVNFLKAALDLPAVVIYARECTVQEIDRVSAAEFEEAYHIQGAGPHTLARFGVFHNNILLGVMSLGSHPRQGHADTVVLERLCYKTGYRVPFAASKLLNLAAAWAKSKGYRKLRTWSDNRLTDGALYGKIGFVFKQDLKPSPYYIMKRNGRNVRVNKQSYKNKLKQRPTRVTREAYARSNGMDLMWDCGKKAWEIDL